LIPCIECFYTQYFTNPAYNPRQSIAMPAKKYRKPSPRIDDAVALQQRVAAGEATPAEADEYRRIINEFRRKFFNGQLAPESARRFGIE
jgi:hypothetical protein